MVHLEYGPDVSVSLQNGYGTSAALQRYLQHRSGLLGQALGTSGPAGGHAVTVGEGLGSEVVVVVDVVGVGVGVVVVVVVVMRQEQADERREVEEAQGAERELGAVVDVARYLSQNVASDLLSYESTARKQLSRLQDMARVNGNTARSVSRIVGECIFSAAA